MQRYFAKEKNADHFTLHDSDIHHIKNVMRSRVDDQIEIVYANTVYICQIKNIDPLEFDVIESKKEDRELPIDLTIAVALVNEQKMDLILQKLTELGVTRIIPIKTERSIVKLDDKKTTKKIDRWQMICKEASEQSKRTMVPIVENIMTLKELASQKNTLKLICSLSDGTKNIASYAKTDLKDILVTIGPEGGFTASEENFLLSNGFMPVTLGKRVMRVETATIYVASIIKYIYEGWFYEIYNWFL